MIDWSKLGPANSPAPNTPDTTAPVAPSSPGSLTQPVPSTPPSQGGSGLLGLAPVGNAPAAQPGGYKIGGNPWEATQADVDALSIPDRIGRGFDVLGNVLFGEGNGSPLGGVPILPDLIEMGGDAIHGGIDATVVKPLEAAKAGLDRIPLGWVPGGADENFAAIGQKLEAAAGSDPFYAAAWEEWQKVNAAANGDFLYGGNLRGEFNSEFLKAQDDRLHDSMLGTTPDLVIGKAGVGSAGQTLERAIGIFLGIGGNTAQRALGEAGAFDPSGSLIGAGTPGLSWSFEESQKHYNETGQLSSEDAQYAFDQLKAGKFTEAEARDYYAKNQNAQRNRVEEAMARFDRGAEVSDVEKKAIEAVRSGEWSMAHAQDWIVTHGQSITRNPVGQIAGGILTDPLTYATIGAGAISKAGVKTGAAVLESAGKAGQAASFAEKIGVAGQQATTYQKLAVTIRAVQESQLGPAFRIARGLIDPLAVYKPGTAARAVTDLKNGVALQAFERAYGPQTVSDLRAIGREFGMTTEVDSAIASYAIDQANLMVARTMQKSLLEEGVGEALVHSNVDDVIEPVVNQAGRDAVDRLTTHMYTVAKNGFTKEEEMNLAGRLSATFGNDVPFWEARIAKMSPDLKSALHATTYKRAEVEFAEAMAKVQSANYTGDLPLRNTVLISTETLDNVRAEAVIKRIQALLAGEEGEAKIAMATAEWNHQAARYPKMANMGFATGGKEQVETLLKQLQNELDSGGLTRRALDEELSDPALKPLRDMLDRNSVPGPALTEEEALAAASIRRADAERAIANAGFQPVSPEKFFAAIKKAQTVVKSNGRSVGETVYRYPKGEYRKMRLYLSEDGKAGFAIKEDGDLVSVFNGGNKRGAIQQIIPDLHALGATKLDAFDESGRLPELYGQGGFKEVRREPWNPAYAPDGWTGGTPDVVYMEHPGLPTDGVRRNWNIGFRPDEEVAWGLKRDTNTGRYIVDRDPTISHVMDAVPGRAPFSDTTRNVLGQIIGKSKAERLNRPIDSIEAMANTMRDGVDGRRLVLNIEKRYERIAMEAGIPAPLAKTIFTKAREVAGLDFTTVRGIRPDNLWKSIADDIPRDLRLADGTTLNIHTVMDHLLTAAEGDLRIMGLTSVLSQRIRNALRRSGMDPANWGGQMTVTMYNKLRYSQPMFLIQRITDAPYYSILYGVTPVGKSLTGEVGELGKVTDNLGRTGLARDFSMDMPEYATRSNFTAGIKSSMQEAGLVSNKLDRIIRAPDAIIAANMTNMLHARLGDIVRGALDNLATAAEQADPALLDDMLRAGEELKRSFGEWRAIYSEAEGRVLTDDEVGFRYIRDQLASWRRHIVNEDGTISLQKLIHEGERAMPASIGDIGPIRPDDLAQELGYADAASLRRDVVGRIEKVNGEFIPMRGEHDIAWLEEQLRVTLGAHPDYTRRALAYFGETWDDFWTRLSRGVDEGGLDISPHYAREAQEVIAREASKRGMDPWEYLSGVVAMNIGPNDLDNAMGQLVGFLKAGKAKMPLEEWTKQFRMTLDVSAQRTLLQEFESAVNVEDVLPNLPTPGAPGSAIPRPGAPAVATMPKGYTTDPGYMYRVEPLDEARMGWNPRTGVSVEATPFYFRGRPGEGVFRAKLADGTDVSVGRHGAGGKDRLTSRAVPPEEIEMLDANGQWVPLGADPMVKVMAKDFPEVVRQRILDGVPHPNPEVEGYIRAFSKWVQDNIQTELGGQTRADLRRLVEAVPTDGAVNFNRSHALVISLLKNKIEDAQNDIFRLAEMQTQRTVLERSLNHPLFGLYPASYMWGKVLPETVKFLAKNPYAATYTILNVSRAIAIQREYDEDFDSKMDSVDRSAGAFLADYMTPGLPWSDHSARMSPMMRDIFAGKDPWTIWADELRTVSPDRWIGQFRDTIKEIPGAIESLQQPPEGAVEQSLGLTGIAGGGSAPAGGSEPVSIAGPTKASGLAPILADDLARLQSILISGEDAGE